MAIETGFKKQFAVVGGSGSPEDYAGGMAAGQDDIMLTNISGVIGATNIPADVFFGLYTGATALTSLANTARYINFPKGSLIIDVPGAGLVVKTGVAGVNTFSRAALTALV